MLKKLFILGIFICFSVKSQSQPQNAKVYYKNVNVAEMHLINGRYQNAINAYLSAFSALSPKINDAHNAILVALELSDLKQAIHFCKILFYKGVKPSYFYQKRFRKLTDSEAWKILMKDTYPVIAEEVAKKLDSALREEIVTMYQKDQKYRVRYNRDSMLSADMGNYILLRKIFTKHGFPNEDKLGVFMENDTMFNYTTPIGIMLIHQVDYLDSWLMKKMKKYAKQGALPMPLFMEFGARTQTDSTLFFGIGWISQNLYTQIENKVYTCDEKTFTLIDKNRKSYNLESTTELKEKVEYYFFKSKKFKLNINATTYMVEFIDSAKIPAYVKQNNLTLFKELPNNEEYFKW